jgi:drug/metabolite transporter (DMT)-like permease
VSGSRRSAIFWAFAAIYVLWGSTYLGIQVALETIPPFTLGASRFLIAGGLIYLWARGRGEPAPERSSWGLATLLGTLFFVLGNGLVIWAQQHVPSGRTALLASTSPIWMVVIESGLDGWKRPPARVIAGIALGMTGLTLLARGGEGPGGAISIGGVLALVGASVAWAIGAVISHRRHLPASPAMATGMKMLAGGALLSVLSIGSGEAGRFEVGRASAESMVAVGYLVVFGSIIGFTAFTFLLRESTPQMVGTASYINPLVAVFLGWALAGEQVTGRMLLGAAVSLSGVVLIRWPRRTDPVPAEEVGTLETGDVEFGWSGETRRDGPER